ncbi:hypothetical protein IQ250_20535 [Pseudanabaenaceae cyanobacterium LEGE 13415]|nr:hypothetical protein [Pseudanabaenaceae cyanobacterium LEGE 13415]
MIHHISIAAFDPHHVAEVLAELLQGQAAPFPYHEGSYMALSLDPNGTLIEVLPRGTELRPVGEFVRPSHPQTVQYNAFHAAVSVSITEAEVHRIAQREGWTVQTCDRAGFFHVIEVWIENQQLLEFLPPTFTAQYLAFTHPDALKPFLLLTAA